MHNTFLSMYSLSRREESNKHELSVCLCVHISLIGQKNNVRMNGIILSKTWPKVIVDGESESEVDFNQLIILRVWVWVGEIWITHLHPPYIHNLLMVRKQPFYAKELSESIDERYLWLKWREVNTSNLIIFLYVCDKIIFMLNMYLKNVSF